MSRNTDSKSEPHVRDLIAERRRNLTRVVPVRNLHKTAHFCCIGPNQLGTVTPMDAHRYRAWLRQTTVDEGITDDELLGKPKAKKRKEAQ